MDDMKYGVADPASLAGMTGKEILRSIIDGGLGQPPIAQTLSFWITEIGDGFAVFEGEPGAHLLNPMGGVHGGWALTLIDSVCGCAGWSLLPAGAGFATIETKANFSRPIGEGTGRVRAEARVVAQGRQIISAEAKVMSRDGKVLAHGTSTLMVLGGRRDETRILVDRLWPRRVTRDKVDLWLKGIAPSAVPQKRFHGKTADWDSFRDAYCIELESPAAQTAARTVFRRLGRGTVTLLYAARDEKRNNGAALKAWLDRNRTEPLPGPWHAVTAAPVKKTLHLGNKSHHFETVLFQHTPRIQVLRPSESDDLGQFENGVGEDRAGRRKFGGVTLSPGRRPEEIADLDTPDGIKWIDIKPTPTDNLAASPAQDGPRCVAVPAAEPFVHGHPAAAFA